MSRLLDINLTDSQAAVLPLQSGGGFGISLKWMQSKSTRTRGHIFKRVTHGNEVRADLENNVI